MNEEGMIISRRNPAYLPEDFDRPMVFIAEAGDIVGTRIGVKTDWYCLCLDADAHHFNKEHPIFHGPFEVNISVEEYALV